MHYLTDFFKGWNEKTMNWRDSWRATYLQETLSVTSTQRWSNVSESSSWDMWLEGIVCSYFFKFSPAYFNFHFVMTLYDVKLANLNSGMTCFYLTLRKSTGIIISCNGLQVSFHQRGRSQGPVHFHRHFLTSCPDLWESHHAGHDHRQLEVPRRNLLRQSNCLPGCSHRHLSDRP